jgi:endonuclease-3
MAFLSKEALRGARARQIVSYLKRTYPSSRSELIYRTPFQFVVAVILSAQCTDKAVNRLTETLFKTYQTPSDFANARLDDFTKEVSSVTFYRNKAKAIIAAGKMVTEVFGDKVPQSESELVRLPGVGYKTAHVVLGELYDV